MKTRHWLKIIARASVLLLALFGASSVVTKDHEPTIVRGPIAVSEDIDKEFSRTADDCDKLRQELNDTDKEIAKKEDELSGPAKLKDCEAKLREAEQDYKSAVHRISVLKKDATKRDFDQVVELGLTVVAKKKECDALRAKVRALDAKRKEALQKELEQLRNKRDELAQQLKDCEEAAKREGAKAGPEVVTPPVVTPPVVPPPVVTPPGPAPCTCTVIGHYLAFPGYGGPAPDDPAIVPWSGSVAALATALEAKFADPQMKRNYDVYVLVRCVCPPRAAFSQWAKAGEFAPGASKDEFEKGIDNAIKAVSSQ